MFKDALLIALKDLKSRQAHLGCTILAIALIFSSFGCAVSGIESFIMPNSICWLVFPLAIGPVIAVPAGSRILSDETSTNMLEVLMVTGVAPSAFVIGKSVKPILWGIITSALSYVAAQIGFCLCGNSEFMLYGFGFSFLLTSLTSTVAASLFLISFAVALSNESIYSAAAICIAIGPMLLLCNNYAALGLVSPSETLPTALAINCILCVAAFVYALWLLRPGSPHWMTSS